MEMLVNDNSLIIKDGEDLVEYIIAPNLFVEMKRILARFGKDTFSPNGKGFWKRDRKPIRTSDCEKLHKYDDLALNKQYEIIKERKGQ